MVIRVEKFAISLAINLERIGKCQILTIAILSSYSMFQARLAPFALNSYL